MDRRRLRAATAAMFLISFGLVLFELLLTRLFAVVLFAQLAHLALALALLGIGVGSVAQYMRPSLVPEEGFERRLGWLCLIQAAAALLAVVVAISVPLMRPEAGRGHGYADQLQVGWFIVLLVLLLVPFIAAGVAFAGAFQRRKEHIGRLYGADLIGGGVAAVAFIPLLGWLAGPDLVFVVIGACALGAWLLFRVAPARRSAWVGVATMGATGAAVIGALAVGELLPVRTFHAHDAGRVEYTEWTPLSRLAIYPEHGVTKVFLDAGSSSEIIVTRPHALEMRAQMHRSLVYELYDPPADIAVLAAAAGPDVAIAQSYGFEGIEAIDIVSEIADLVATRYADAPANPYVVGNTRRIKADARAAILHSAHEYDIIHMVHANLWSMTGMIANAWSPSLLETVEAFETYLDRLTDRGTVSFGRGPFTTALARAAAEALGRRGVTDPWRYIAYVSRGRRVQTVLVKKRPWTPAEIDRLHAAVSRHPGAVIEADPGQPLGPRGRELFTTGVVLTDDRPYLDEPGRMTDAFLALLRGDGEELEREDYVGRIYKALAIQWVFVLVVGALLIFLPLARRGTAELRRVRGAGVGLLYVSAIGYGYLAIEIVLIHELVMFVGHPTYAVTIVILSMLVCSGLGSIVSGRLPAHRSTGYLQAALLAVLALGALHALLVPGWLTSLGLGWSLPARTVITGLALAPLGFAMGMPFPLAMRLLPASASGLVPWAWALNGWMSVVASLATVVAARQYGYRSAFALALGAYVIALLLAPRVRTIGSTSSG